MHIEATAESWPIDGTFTIARGSKSQATVVVAAVSEGGFSGRGECVPYARYGESVDNVIAAIESADPSAGLADLQAQLPPGAARNALDCALWDLRAKREGKRVWQLLDLAPPQPQLCAYTLSLGSPEEMESAARKHADAPLLKIKLGGQRDAERTAAVRRGAPNARIIADANEGWTPEQYANLVPQLQELGVVMIEQPLPADNDLALAQMPRPIPICADESCHDRTSLEQLPERYDMINIKLDKTGGLTEALALRDAAQQAGLDIMVGCMVGTSLAMAPALLVAQGAAIVDLDGPLLLSQDRTNKIHYSEGFAYPSTRECWG